MTAIVICALLVAFAIYLSVGFILGKHTKGIGDMLPLGFGKQARVANSSEFSASTVATTISLATVVIAFFELSAAFGVWLLLVLALQPWRPELALAALFPLMFTITGSIIVCGSFQPRMMDLVQ